MATQLSEDKEEKIDYELWKSARDGHLENTKQALQKGANFKCRFTINDGKGRYVTKTTPHTVAYINGHNTIVEFLENGGVTPDYDEIMLAAAVRGLRVIVKEAIEMEANVNDQHLDSDDDTALHLASGNGHIETVQFLLLSNADPNIHNRYGQTPAHVAIQEGRFEVLKLLIEVGQVDINVTDKSQNASLHYASLNNQNEIVQFLLQSNVDPNIYNKWGLSPLHLAYWKGYHNIVNLLCSFGGNMDQVKNDDLLLTSAENGDIKNVTQALTSGANVNVHHPRKDQITALHLVSKGGHYNIVQLLLNFKADPNICDEYGLTAGHHASQKGHVDILKLLIEVGQVDINATDQHGLTPAHHASQKGHVDVLKLLIELRQVDINAIDNHGLTLAHHASQKGHVDVLKLLIEVGQVDINVTDKHGLTPAHHASQKGHVDVLKLLIEVGEIDINVTDQGDSNLLHLACESGSEETIHYLLHNAQLNPDHLVAVNNHQQMPLDCIPPSSRNKFQLLKLFQPFEQCHRDYLTESYVKLFLCGKTEAGKSSLAAVISYRADIGQYGFYDPEECVEGVVTKTTGIEYHSVCSREIGNVVIFDFAGHAEYYSSHAAVLETLLLRSPAVFAILSNLTDDEKTIEKDLLFWFNFVENASKKLISSSHVLVLGSHIDELSSEKDFHPFVNDVANMAVRFQNYKGFFPIDCHRPGGKGVEMFMEKLRESCEAVVDKNDKMSYHCHCLNSYLQQLEVVAISLDELCSKLIELNEPCLLTDRSTVLEFLTILGSKGLILFLANTWVIIDKKALLIDVNGVLFNKTIDRERKPVASNTGIMPVSTLANLFKNHNTDMLISFLTSLQFCHQMDSSTISCITNNVPSDDFPISKDEKFLFFPALITEDKPTSIFKTRDGFGWCLYCPNPFQFLSVRFLHILLLQLAYLYSLPCRRKAGELDKKSPKQQFDRRCTVWKNGIYWKHSTDVVVEVTDNNRCVTVFVSNDKGVESQKICCSVIKLILSLQKQLCPCKIDMYIIPSGSLADICSKAISERILYRVNDVARGMLVNEEIFDHNGVQDSSINVKHICPYEPYISLAPAVIHALFSNNKANQVIPERFLQHIQEFAPSIMSSYNTSKGNTYSDVASHINDYSFFIGQNPLDLLTQLLSRDEILSISKDRLQSTNISTLKEKTPTKALLLNHMSKIYYQWYTIGECLGIENGDLNSLKSSNQNDYFNLSQILQLWMDRMTKPVTWNTILEVIGSPPIENKCVVIEIEKFLESQTKGSSDICDDDLLELLTTTEDVTQTDKNTIKPQSDDVDKSVSEFIRDENNTASGGVAQTNKKTIDEQTDGINKSESIAKDINTVNENVTQTDKNTIKPQNDDVDKSVNESITKDNNTVSGGVAQTDKNTFDNQTDGVDKSVIESISEDSHRVNECANESSGPNLTEESITDNLSIEHQQQSTNELSSEHKSDTFPSNTTQQAPAKRKRSFSHSTSKKLKQSDNRDDDQLETNPGSLKRKHSNSVKSDDLPKTKKYAQEQQESNVKDNIDPSEIFQEYFTDICEAIQVKPSLIVNRLFSANLISSTFKKDVESMSGDPYNIADKVVDELQQQVEKKGIVFLKAICDFFLEQNHELQNIGARMKRQLES